MSNSPILLVSELHKVEKLMQKIERIGLMTMALGLLLIISMLLWVSA
jgi:hypothetical protein